MSQFALINARDLPPDQGIILDVRTAMEHAEKHIGMKHIHIPLDELIPDNFMAEYGINHDSLLYILCRSGKRACQAAEKFIAAGCRNIKVIEGGIVACEACGHPIKSDYTAQNNSTSTQCRLPIPLERQVRIVAGFFVVLGTVLGTLIHPAFTMISFFVGCGLIFAGVTDRCGLALILTKAPWNKILPK